MRSGEQSNSTPLFRSNDHQPHGNSVKRCEYSNGAAALQQQESEASDGPGHSRPSFEVSRKIRAAVVSPRRPHRLGEHAWNYATANGLGEPSRDRINARARMNSSVGDKPTNSPDFPSVDEEEILWETLRQGARNVAGVSFQIAVAVFVLTSGRATELPYTQITPEGLEDVDCLDVDGRRTLIQVKEVGAGAGRLTAADVADALVHAADAAGNSDQVVLVTDGSLGSNLQFTGWVATLNLQGGRGYDDVVTHMENRGLTKEQAHSLGSRTHLVNVPWNIRGETEQLLARSLGLHPTVASLTISRMYELVTTSSANQRATSSTSAFTHGIRDFDVIVREIQDVVDIQGLDAAIAEGVCEPADFVNASELSEAQFLGGVDGAPSHVAANLDVLRPQEMSEIIEAVRQERYAVLLGPSGAGKSVLLWRAARDAVLGSRVIRVRRCSSLRDVDLLVRHVRQLRPSATAQVVVAADNLGRPGMQQWPSAVDALREVSSVMLIGAVRAEDFTQRLVRGAARVVELRLDHPTATRIFRVIQAAGIPTRMDGLEAEELAHGLLMEFIALVTTGDRLEKILAEQVEALRQPDRALQRNLARLVTAAHSAGVAIPTSRLVSIPAPLEAIGDALSVLKGEHVVVTNDGCWQGLHELRSTIITRQLHESPPPTLASTLGEVASLLPAEAVGWLLRRAAEFLGEDVVDIAVALVTRGMTASEVTVILEGAERADNTLYARACLPTLQAAVKPGVTVRQLGTLVYAMRNQDLRLEGTDEERIDNAYAVVQEIADQLPRRSSPVASQFGSQLDSDRIVELTQSLSLQDTVRLIEAADTAIQLTPDAVATIVGRFDNPDDANDADLYARLIAGVIAAAELTPPQIVAAFGSADLRAQLVTNPDPAAVDVEFESSSGVAKVTLMFAPVSEREVTSLAWDQSPRESSDRANDEAVRAARRLADAIPEASIFEVVTIAPSGKLLRIADHDWAQKRMPRSTFPQRNDVRRNVGFQAALGRLTAADSWTTLVRSQTALAEELIPLLREAPGRLLSHDHARRRNDWRHRAEVAKSRAAELASPPGSTTHSPGASDARRDEDDRRTDLTSDALIQIADTLPRLLTDVRYGSLAAALQEASKKIDEARSASDPWLAGLGRPLPDELLNVVNQTVEILAAAHYDPTLLRRLHRIDVQDAIRARIDAVIRLSEEAERAHLAQRLGEVGSARIHRVMDHESLATNVGGHAWVVTVSMADLDNTLEALRGFHDANSTVLGAKVMIAALENDIVLPVVLQLSYVGEPPALPLLPYMFEPYTEQLPFKMLTGRALSFFRETLDALSAISVGAALEQRRRHDWPTKYVNTKPTLDEIEAMCESEFDSASDAESVMLKDSLQLLVAHVRLECEGSASASLAGELITGRGFGPAENLAFAEIWEAIGVASMASMLHALFEMKSGMTPQ